MVLHIINQGFERAYGAVAKVTLTSVNIADVISMAVKCLASLQA